MTHLIAAQAAEKMATLVNECHDLRKENAQQKKDIVDLLERINNLQKEIADNEPQKVS